MNSGGVEYLAHSILAGLAGWAVFAVCIIVVAYAAGHIWTELRK